MKWFHTVAQSFFISLYVYGLMFVFLAYKVLWPQRFLANGTPHGQNWLYIADKALSITTIYLWPMFVLTAMYGRKITWDRCKWIIVPSLVVGLVYTSLYETIFRQAYIHHHTFITTPIYMHYGIVTVFCGWRMSHALEWKQFHLFFTLPMLAAGGCAWLYDRLVFTWIWYLENDTMVIVFRLVVHPLVMEGALCLLKLFHRRMYRTGNHVFIMHVQWVMLNALYGRLLIVRLISAENVLWTLLVVMVTEIGLRSTVKDRDMFFMKLVEKWSPRIAMGNARATSHPEMERLRSDIIALELIVEFFAIMFIPTATFLYQIDNRNVDQIIFAIVLQITIEFITATICVFIDSYRGLLTTEHWEDRDEHHEGIIVTNIIMGVIYLIFSLSFYIISIKNL